MLPSFTFFFLLLPRLLGVLCGSFMFRRVCDETAPYRCFLRLPASQLDRQTVPAEAGESSVTENGLKMKQEATSGGDKECDRQTDRDWPCPIPSTESVPQFYGL